MLIFTAFLTQSPLSSQSDSKNQTRDSFRARAICAVWRCVFGVHSLSPKTYGGRKLIHYSVVSLWVNALECAAGARARRRGAGGVRGVRGGGGLGEHARRDSRVAGNQPTRAFGEVSPDKTRLHAERAWLNFNVAKLPPPLRRCWLVHQTSRNKGVEDANPRTNIQPCRCMLLQNKA